MAKILLIEDDLALAQVVKGSLETNTHHVDLLTDGKEGLLWLKNESYDLAIVDWNLPGLPGVSICQEYRNSGGTIPILMLTGKQGVNDIVTGLDSGADDYLSKPFKIDELLARLRSLLRRLPSVQAQRVRLHNVEIESGGANVKVDGVQIDLPRKEFAILELLMRNPGIVFSIETIMDRAWPSDSESSPENIRCHITRLRKKLEDVSSGSSNFIKTVYGCGYKAEPEQ